ncbi:MAG: DivIVA domain-containing protein [Treponema sp.]|nr:DivIVA domain-containing protein [Treponema sp.]
MDVQLQELIDKIKRDGVAVAENSASEMISNAEKEAKRIIDNAKREAENIIDQAKEEANRFEKSSEDSIKQASRNLLLQFRDSVTKELSSIVNETISDSISKDSLEKLIPEIIKEWTKNSDAKDISVLLSEKDLQTLESSFKNSLKNEISQGLTLKVDNSLSKGFRVGIKDGAAFYDFSAETVAELFSAYLNPKVSALMKEAAK